MDARYYARVDLDAGGYCGLVKLEEGRAYRLVRFGSVNGMVWEEENALYGVPEDTTHYDELTGEQAEKLMEEWGKG